MKRTPTSLLAVALLALAATACAQESGDGGGLLASLGEGPVAPVASDDPGAVADQAVTDVTAYWEQTFPEVYGGQFRPVAGFYPYGPDTAAPPCGSPPPRYEEIANNAFYCPGDDIIAWDEAVLLPDINEQFGSFTVAIVIAHEFGHAIQDRASAFDRTVDLELQADCFAGAWTAHVAGGDSAFDPGIIDLDKTVAGMLAIRDIPGTDPDDIMAHGSGFDRVAAFQDGYESGAGKCATYADEGEDRTTAELPPDDDFFDSGGDFPLYDDEAPGNEGLLTLLERDLNDFYSTLFDELGAEFAPVDGLVLADPGRDELRCGDETLSGRDLEYAAVYCVDQNVVVLDGEVLVPRLYDEIGDFAVASEVARLWALAAQVQLDVVDAEEADLQADCLTGRWAAWTFPRDPRAAEPTSESGELVMSAGDLDEGIMGFIAYGAGLGEQERTVFERADALRTGFFGGYAACEEEYGRLG